MIIKPRWYQSPLIADTYKAWNAGYRNVALVAPCRSGKSYTAGFIAREFNNRKQYVIQFAHRDVLLSQLSLSYATLGIRHNLICNKAAKRFIGDLHTLELGESFISETANVCIASIATFNNLNTTSWESSVGLWMMDETHHLLLENQWGRAVSRFENAYGFGATATFCRLDRKGLGRCSDGVFDIVVSGVTPGDLIQSGDLTRYRIVHTPLSQEIHNEMKDVRLNSGGEYNREEKEKILGNKQKVIIGDVVGTYKKFNNGYPGLTFCQDIDACEKQAAAYRAQGVTAVALSSKSPSPTKRWEEIEKFKNGETLQLVNCELFGEGFDVPCCYSVSLVNPTKSYGKFIQEFFRSLTPDKGKLYGWVFDHVGNVKEHGLPDYGLDWDEYLERPPRGVKRGDNENACKITTCTNPDCQSDYELPASVCPWCGKPYTISIRGALKNVGGELVEMTEEEMNQLRNKYRIITKDANSFRKFIEPTHKGWGVVDAMVENHIKRQAAHNELMDRMYHWADKARDIGLTPKQAQVQFAQLFQCDVYTAKSLNTKDAKKLMERIDL